MSGRSPYPIRSASPKPRVIANSVGSPLRSSSALVATVVPMRTVAGGGSAPAGVPVNRRIASTPASP